MKKVFYTVVAAPAVCLYLFWLDVNLFFFIHGRKIKLSLLHILHIIVWILVFSLIFAKATEPITGTF